LLTIAVIDGIEIFVVALVVTAIFSVLALRCWRSGVPLVLTWLGSISYTLYLVHQHIGFVIMLFAQARGMPPLAAVGLALTAVLLLAWALTTWIEKPALAAIRDQWRIRSGTVQPNA
jgi:peptidoglycan/LPS O-acetylase OafA/YrhL